MNLPESASPGTLIWARTLVAAWLVDVTVSALFAMKTSGRVAPCGALLCFSHPGLKRILCGIASRRGRPGQQQQQQQQKLSVRVHATEDVPGPADADEGEELQVSGDWRAFQASLIKQQFSRAGAAQPGISTRLSHSLHHSCVTLWGIR